MKAVILFELVFALLCVSTTIADSQHVRFWAETIEPHLSSNKGFVTCFCDGRKVTEELPKDQFEEAFFNVKSYGYCPKKSTRPCKFSKSCTNCTATMTKCIPAPVFNGSKCVKRGLEFESRNVPQQSIGHTILKRNHLGIKCFYPRTLETADITCVRYNDSFIICFERCIFGYTLKEGISRMMACHHQENKWSGRGVFEECKPFVDCMPRLVGGGSMTCNTGSVRKAPYCTVSCSSYEDSPAFSNQTFQCTTSGKWEPELPSCLQPRGIKLERTPKIKDHDFHDSLLLKWTPPAFATNVISLLPMDKITSTLN